MQLSETQKFLLRYAKNGEYKFNYKDIITAGLGEIYHYHMGLHNVHTIVYRAFKGFCGVDKFEMPLDAEYRVLTSVALDYDYRFKGIDKAMSVEEVLQSQITEMMTFIVMTRVDWLNDSYKD